MRGCGFRKNIECSKKVIIKYSLISASIFIFAGVFSKLVNKGLLVDIFTLISASAFCLSLFFVFGQFKMLLPNWLTIALAMLGEATYWVYLTHNKLIYRYSSQIDIGMFIFISWLESLVICVIYNAVDKGVRKR